MPEQRASRSRAGSPRPLDQWRRWRSRSPRSSPRSEELPKRLSKKALDAEVRALFDALVEDVRRARGDRSAEADLFRRAAGTLVILRTRGGDPIPEAHVPHILATDGWDARTAAPMVRLDASPEESERWFAAVDEGSR